MNKGQLQEETDPAFMLFSFHLLNLRLSSYKIILFNIQNDI